jgi:hypothetical protein
VESCDAAERLDRYGYILVDGFFRTARKANAFAGAIVEMCRVKRSLPPLSSLGDFVVPPLTGTTSRDFQTLHFDFGLPLDPKTTQEVARYTALHVPAEVTSIQALTRLVPLVDLLGLRSWALHETLVERLVSYGRTHGAWDDDRGYVKGSLARIVEAAAGDSIPTLPSVKEHPEFLCGMEFDSLAEEVRFFEFHGLQLREVEIDVALQPGELLVFNNLTMAHGRCGARRPGELRQRVYGHTLQPDAQLVLRDAILAAFTVEGKHEVPLFDGTPFHSASSIAG